LLRDQAHEACCEALNQPLQAGLIWKDLSDPEQQTRQLKARACERWMARMKDARIRLDDAWLSQHCSIEVASPLQLWDILGREPRPSWNLPLQEAIKSPALLDWLNRLRGFIDQALRNVFFEQNVRVGVSYCQL
jgi:hypothetical protein